MSENSSYGDPGEVESEEVSKRGSTIEVMLDHILGPAIRTVLIKGEPGTGKTTLAIELLKEYGKGLYVSTRVSKETLIQQNPQLRRLVEEGYISSFEISDRMDFKFEDYRLASAGDVLQSILSASKKFQRESLVVLDSWDSIASKLDPSDRIKTEQALLAIAEANNVKLLFVSEEDRLSTTDYLVDAVIRLEDGELDGMRVRRVVWKKLRGSRIPHRSSLYSLEGGRITIFNPTSVLTAGEYKIGNFSAIPNSDSRYSSGSKDLDTFLGGGFRRGSTILLELDNRMGRDWPYPIGWSVEMNFLANQGCVLVFPSGNRPARTVKSVLTPYFSSELLERNLRIIQYDNDEEKDTCLLPLENFSGEDPQAITKELAMIKQGRKIHCLYFLGHDTFETGPVAKSTEQLGILVSGMVRQTGDLAVVVVKQGSRLIRDLNNLCDVHLKLEELDRTLVMHSIKPVSELYHVGYDYSPGYPYVRLRAIV